MSYQFRPEDAYAVGQFMANVELTLKLIALALWVIAVVAVVFMLDMVIL